jgi:Uma2 family endonuclease
MTTNVQTLLTADEFAELGDIGRADLIRGRVVPLTKPKPKHGRITMRLGSAVERFVRRHKLGETYAAETGYLLERDPDTVRAPDVSFVRAELAKKHNEDEWYPHSPDLAVEVISPSDTPQQVTDKIELWLRHGARSVWVIDPVARTLTIHRADGTEELIREDEPLRDQAVLPGFSIRPLGKIFS